MTEKADEDKIDNGTFSRTWVEGDYKCSIVVRGHEVWLYRWRKDAAMDNDSMRISHKGATIEIEGASLTACTGFQTLDRVTGR